MPGARRRFFLELLRRLVPFVTVFLGVYLIASVGFYLLDGGQQTLFSSFYWAIVTLSTVGYGDVVPVTQIARLFTIGILFVQIFLGGYLFSVIVGIMSEESQKRALGTLGTDMKDHTVVLGYGSVGKSCVRELLIAEQHVAVVTQHAEDVANIHSLAGLDRLFATYGSPADVEILHRVNVPLAHSVVVCTEDDTQTLIAALNVRTLAPEVRIVVSVVRPELKTTLRSAGVTYVASPSDMGGRLCAAAAFEPEVANAFDHLTETGEGADLREYVLSERTPLTTQGLRDAEALVRQHTGGIVVGAAHRGPNGEYATQLNPPDSYQFRPGDTVLILATIENQDRFRRWFGVEQGR